MIPTRQQVQDKIDEIRSDPAFSSLKSEVYQRIVDWLDSIETPNQDKEMILDDLNSYANY